MYPDGGIARLRVYGQPVGGLENATGGQLVDLIALENGGRPVSWNDASFGSTVTALLAARARCKYGRWLGNPPPPRAGQRLVRD